MTENAVYLVSEEVARRAGVQDVAYVTEDGRFVIDLADFKRVRLTPEEYITGIAGVERITAEEAKLLVIANGYRRAGDLAAGAGETEAGQEREPGQEQEEQESGGTETEVREESQEKQEEE